MPLDMTALCAFPWDMADRGVDTTLALCRDLGVSHLFLCVNYHAGFLFYPNNPRRQVDLLEDGVTYFRPRLALYADTPLKPTPSVLCRDTDWVETISRRLPDYGLELCAWTVCLHNTKLGLQHPDCTVENALGDCYPHALCPSHPHAQAYVEALLRDVTERFPMAMVMLEAADYRGRRHGGAWVSGHHHERDGIVLAPLEQTLLDLSFNTADIAAAQAENIDALAVRQAVREHLLACLAAYPDRPAGRPTSLAEFEAVTPGLAAYRACLTRQVEGLAQRLRRVVPAHIQLIGAPAAAHDWVLAGAYWQSPAGVATVTQAAWAKAHPHQKVLVGIRLGFNPPDVAAVHSQPQLTQCIQALTEQGADGVMFYNLAETPEHNLRWIPTSLRKAARPRPPTDLKLGLIGCGNISTAYLRAARRVDGLAITAVADVDLDQAKRQAAAFNISATFPDVPSLLANSDATGVIIAVPPKWHAPVLQQCLDAGKHVLLEKPPGFDLAEADAMVDWVEQSGRTVGVGLVHRYLPFYRVMRDLIQAGSLGRIRQLRFRTGRDIYGDPRFSAPADTRGGWLTRPDIAGGGILMSSTIHLFSVAAFLLQDQPFAGVTAITRQLHPRAYAGIEDDVTVLLQTSAGVEVMVEDSWGREWPFEMEVRGDQGWVQAAGGSWADNVVLTGHLGGDIPAAYGELGLTRGFTVNAAHFADLCPPLFEGLLADFRASIQLGRPTPTLPTLPHARNMQAVVAACYTSATRAARMPIVWR